MWECASKNTEPKNPVLLEQIHLGRWRLIFFVGLHTFFFPHFARKIRILEYGNPKLECQWSMTKWWWIFLLSPNDVENTPNPNEAGLFLGSHLNKKCNENYQGLGVSKNRGTPKWMAYNGKPCWNSWFGDTPICGNTYFCTQQNNKTHLFVPHAMGDLCLAVFSLQLGGWSPHVSDTWLVKGGKPRHLPWKSKSTIDSMVFSKRPLCK